MRECRGGIPTHQLYWSPDDIEFHESMRDPFTNQFLRITEYDAGVARVLYRRFDLGKPQCSEANFTVDVRSGVDVGSGTFEAPSMSLL